VASAIALSAGARSWPYRALHRVEHERDLRRVRRPRPFRPHRLGDVREAVVIRGRPRGGNRPHDEARRLHHHPVHGHERAAAVHEAAAVNPHHDRQLLRRPLGRTTDVQHEAVFRRWRAEGCRVTRERQLRAVAAVRGRAPHARPGRDGLRGTPADVADWRCRERDALERADAVLDRAFEHAASHLYLVARGADRQRGPDGHCRQQRADGRRQLVRHRCPSRDAEPR
jgi:hypothetical protein